MPKYNSKKLSVEEFKKKHFARHFFILIIVTICVQSNFFLLSYLTNLFTQVYTTAVCAAISMATGFLFSGWLLERVGLRVSFFIGSAVASSGGLCLLFFGLHNQDSLIFPVLFLFSFMGISFNYNLCFACVVKLFEVKRAARVLGVASFFARAFTAAVPLVSTLEQPVPMILFCVTTICSGVLTGFFIEPPREAHKIKKKQVKPAKMSVTKV